MMGFLAKYGASSTNRLVQRILRVLQFLSAIISLGLFSSRIYKIIRLANRAVTTSNRAVESILAIAALYTLAVTIVQLCLKRGAPKILRWILIAMDILFMGAFIAVAYLTRPNGGSSGPCRNSRYSSIIPNGQNCDLPWGVFILAILSTILHLLTAIFYEVRDHHRANKNQHEGMAENGGRNSRRKAKKNQHSGMNGNGDYGNGNYGNGSYENGNYDNGYARNDLRS